MPIIPMDNYVKGHNNENQVLYVVMAGSGEKVIYAPHKVMVNPQIKQLAADIAAQTYEHQKGIKGKIVVKAGTVIKAKDMEAEAKLLFDKNEAFDKNPTLKDPIKAIEI